MSNNISYKHIIVLIVLLLSTTSLYAQKTVQVDIANFTDTLLCIEGSFTVPVQVTDTFADSNAFRVEMSNSSGSFSNPVLVGVKAGGLGGNASCKLPSSITAGTGYRLRIVATYPTYTSAPTSITVRVSNYPTVNVTVNGPLCEGDTLKLGATTPNPQPTFKWTGPISISQPTQQNPVITNVPATGNGTYRVTVTSFKCSTTDTIDAIIVPTPVWYGWVTDSFSCEGQPFKIKPSCSICTLPTNLVDYEWSYPPNNTPSHQSYINLIASRLSNDGYYKVTVKLKNNNSSHCMVTDSFKAVIKPLPDSPFASNNGPLCVGDTLVLNGNSSTAGVSYKWTGPNNYYDSGLSAHATLPDITNNAKGKYYLYAYKNGCVSHPGVTDVRVGIPLVKLPITGDTMLCPGDKLQLSAQTSVAQGIVWKKLPNDSLIISVNRSYGKSSVSAEDAGTYVVTQEVLGCKSPPSYVHIHIPDLKAPTPKNNGPLCIGEELHLNSTASTKATYYWTGPNGFTSDVQNPTLGNITDSAGGIYTISTQLEYCSDTDTTNVIIKPMPMITEITSNSPVCSDTYLKLHASSSLDSCSYSWAGPGNFTSSNSDTSIYYLDNISGTYTVRATLNGCISAPATTEVTTREGPGNTIAHSNGPLIEGEKMELFAQNDKDSVAFSWKGPENFTSHEQNPVIQVATFRNTGMYELYTTYNTCTTSTKVYVEVKDILGITLNLYPNPNDGKFRINGITQSDAPLTMTIYNHLGGIVYTGTVTPKLSKFEKAVDLRGAPSGVYLLQLVTGGEKRTIRFTIVSQ